jgi:hypothetical protein
VVDVDQAGDLSNRGSTASQLLGVNDFWDIMLTQHPRQEGLRRFSVPMPLKEDIEHEPVLIHGWPAGKRPHAVKCLLGAALTKMGTVLPKKSQRRTPSTLVHPTPRRDAPLNPAVVSGGVGLQRRGVRT